MMWTMEEVKQLRREIAAEVFRDLAEYALRAVRYPLASYHSSLVSLPMSIGKTGIKAGRHCKINLIPKQRAV